MNDARGRMTAMKTGIAILTVIVCFILVWPGLSDGHKAPMRYQTLITSPFDKEEIAAAERLAMRFKQQKGDFLVVVAQTFEGGYVLYDFRSDGNIVHVRIDASRDAFSNGEILTFDCKSIDMKKFTNGSGEKKTGLFVSRCTGAESFEKEVSVISFP
ncbi:DUF4362 domain-containing protein [Paenibacillus sp. HB172176]|uniref:DUF4362 domain-containing protein n=1 Tax=Paenibacillus sp. HB172176 TaxID=2493690 RepID=UPI001438D762|nr:DUF4362 domain-containing protein [Paenibacillus sp. HB172176]